MLIFTQIAYVAAYTMFAVALVSFQRMPVSHLFGFFVFVSVAFGPHTAIFFDYFWYSHSIVATEVHIQYNVIMVAFFLAFSFLFPLLPRRLVSVAPDPSVTGHGGILLRQDKQMHRFCVVASAALVLGSMLLQPGLNVTLVHLQYLAGISAESYTDIRRVLFAGTPWSQFASLVRFTIVPICFSYFLWRGFVHPRTIPKVAYIFVAISLPIVVCVMLNKLFFLFFVSLGTLVYVNTKQQFLLSVSIRHLLPLIAGSAIAAVLLFSALDYMYRLQYSEALEQGYLQASDLAETIVYRPFFASSDALRLWIDYFSNHSDPFGISIVGSLCGFFSSGRCIDVNVLVPSYYLAAELTSMQVGFIGTALGLFGTAGLPLVFLAVLLTLFLNLYCIYSYRNHVTVKIVAPHLFLTSYFLTSAELHTAMLSGGGVSAPLLYLFIRRIRF